MLKKKEQLIPILLFIILLIGGCNAYYGSYAYVGHVCSIDNKDNYYSLSLSKQTSELMFGHSGLVFIMETYTFRLPFKPESRTKYSYKQIYLSSYISRTKNIPESIEGQIVVNLHKHTVEVSLTNQDGNFPGNGEYYLKD
jgi:hypothetical protein